MLRTVIECIDLDAEMEFFVESVGCRIHVVSPADDPRRVVLHHGERDALELIRSDVDRPTRLVAEGEFESDRNLTSPGGTTVTVRPRGGSVAQVVGADMKVPDGVASLSIVEASDGSFGVGRAGMEYCDLLPDRWGGRFIASHIRIVDGGDVADWVHFHRIRFQMIYVAAGWVDVVYEGQGEPFRMEAGDCVLQPPEIRHRVLRSSPGFEVIEIGCPAEHDTVADHELDLPTEAIEPLRDFSGQRFVRHVASAATTTAWVEPSMAARDTGIDAATGGLAGAVVVGPSSSAVDTPSVLTHHGEFVLVVGLSGDATLDVDGRVCELSPLGAMALPAGTRWTWTSRSHDHSALVVSLPADAIAVV
ncbi:MAG: cupin [Ilumatobacter sp.]|uniref:cupin n=1 Tax=Ilumatobacter sp. TaxID=1967498 RepID=UPI00329A4C5D